VPAGARERFLAHGSPRTRGSDENTRVGSPIRRADHAAPKTGRRPGAALSGYRLLLRM